MWGCGYGNEEMMNPSHQRILSYVPRRSHSIMIIIFVALNVAFNFFQFPSFSNETLYLDASVLYNTNLPNRFSVLAIVNLALAIMLSGRSSVIKHLTGCSRKTLIAYHRWAGRVAIVKGVAHAAIYLSTSDKIRQQNVHRGRSTALHRM